jgi:hypothetical protein
MLRKLAYSLAMLLLVYGAAEAFAILCWSLVHRQIFSLHGFQDERARLIDASRAKIAAAAAPKERSYGGHLSDESLHPYLGFTLDLDSRGSYNYPYVSPYGFTDDKSPIQKRAANRVVVGIVGGSFAQEFGVYGTGPLEALLSKAAPFAGKEFVFVRLGMGGYKQPQQLQTFAYLTSLGAEFDYLINIDGFNDIVLPRVENAPRGVNVFYPRMWDVRLQGVSDLKTLRAIGEAEYIAGERERMARVFSGTALRHSPLANVAWEYLDRRLANRADVLGMALLKMKPEFPEPVYSLAANGARTEFKNDEELIEALAALWVRSSLALDRFCESYGVKYFHFLQPNQHLPGSKPMNAEEQALAVLPYSPYADPARQGYPALIGNGRQLLEGGVKFFDMTAVFANRPEPLYKDNCCHLTDEGYALFAGHIADKMLD